MYSALHEKNQGKNILLAVRSLLVNCFSNANIHKINVNTLLILLKKLLPHVFYNIYMFYNIFLTLSSVFPARPRNGRAPERGGLLAGNLIEEGAVAVEAGEGGL